MKRKIENDLTQWFSSSRRKPLILRGARQVGKSTVVRNFCLNNKIELFEVNLEKIQIDELEKEKNFTIAVVIQEIEVVLAKRISSKGLLFFDEIQASPLTIAKLRYFFEEMPELAVISAGSLLEFTLKDHSFSMPVGRIQYLFLGPMTFSEYLIACGEEILLEHMQQCFPKYPNQSIHAKLVDHIKRFICIGGMPEAVKTYITTNSFLEVEKVHNEILQTYQQDFPKYNTAHTDHTLNEVFNYLPRGLGEKAKYSNMSNTSSVAIKKALQLLMNAKIAQKVYYTNCSGLPLEAGENIDRFKLFFLDVGLANFSQGLNWIDLQNLDDEKNLGKGKLTEQFVAQHLFNGTDLSRQSHLHYWYRDVRGASAEIDFVIKLNSQIVPIEVKAGKTGRIRSLLQYIKEKSPEMALRFDLKHRENYKEEITEYSDTTLYSFPLYYIDLIYNSFWED